MALFKLPEHYVFDYKPIYYDPKKEEREKRLRQIKQELGIENEKNDFKFKRDISFRDKSIYHRKRDRSAIIRLGVIMGFLFLLAYLILYTNLVDVFLEKIIK